MAISAKGLTNIYVHRGKHDTDQKIYEKECINRRLTYIVLTEIFYSGLF